MVATFAKGDWDRHALNQTGSRQVVPHRRRTSCWTSPSSTAPGTSDCVTGSKSGFRNHPFRTSPSGTRTAGGDLYIRSPRIAKLPPPQSRVVWYVEIPYARREAP